MAGPTYILIHVFGTVRDELDREDRGKRTYSAWLREYVSEQPQRLTEIARLLEIPEGTAMSHVHRARSQMRRALSDGGVRA